MRLRPSSHASFSLVEVVVAIGLIGFAMIAILAFLPTGLTSNRLSAGETRAAQLARAIIGTIDSQCATFSNVNCYGLSTLDLSALDTMSEADGSATHVLYASYASPNQPSISTTRDANSLYTIELRFKNNPIAALGSVDLGAGKTSLIELRVYSVARNEGPLRFVYLARNKG